MNKENSGAESPRPRSNLLRDQVQLIKRKDLDRYEIVPLPDYLSFEKGFFIVIRACQLLAQNNDGLILVGVAGPSGAGKTVFTEKVLNFMPSIAVISMDNYNDASRIIDGNFDGNSQIHFIVMFYVKLKPVKNYLEPRVGKLGRVMFSSRLFANRKTSHLWRIIIPPFSACFVFPSLHTS